MNLVKTNISSDMMGAIASTVCLIHCAATPFLFIAKSCSSAASCCNDAPLWWKAIDFLFAIISFAAIYYSTKYTTKKWVVNAMWASWGLLMTTILFEAFGSVFIHQSFIYIPAFAIIGLHFYNLKYCKCADEGCCVSA